MRAVKTPMIGPADFGRIVARDGLGERAVLHRVGRTVLSFSGQQRGRLLPRDVPGQAAWPSATTHDLFQIASHSVAVRAAR
jgi:hypothetical protein